MTIIEFVYQSLGGEPAIRRLTDWKESGKYIIGWCDQAKAVRTFRKDRVVQYGEGVADLLSDAFPEPPPPVRRKEMTSPEILFTGFPAALRTELEKFAVESGMRVVKSATKNLSYLCGGQNAGPSKIDKARQNGAWILDQATLFALVETGELPDEAPDESLIDEVAQMTTSELIKALQSIEKTVLFDADIVTYGEIYPRGLVRVFHEPPHIYLAFDGDEAPVDDSNELDLNALSDEEFNLVIAYRKASEAARHAAGVALETGKLSDSAKS